MSLLKFNNKEIFIVSNLQALYANHHHHQFIFANHIYTYSNHQHSNDETSRKVAREARQLNKLAAYDNIKYYSQ